jgi:hypothetical protein
MVRAHRTGKLFRFTNNSRDSRASAADVCCMPAGPAHEAGEYSPVPSAGVLLETYWLLSYSRKMCFTCACLDQTSQAKLKPARFLRSPLARRVGRLRRRELRGDVC